MTLTDILIVSATLISPLIAVQVTRYLDDRKEERGRKLRVFKTLMATRATNLAPAHVEALNQIDLEFNIKVPKEKKVREIWQQYLDHLGARQMETQIWSVRRVDLLVDMLYEMGHSLGYDFSKTSIKNGTYNPTAHGKAEEEQQRFRALFLGLLEGKGSFPMHITGWAPMDGEANAQKEIL